jgi:NADPH:quinone reductase-like Zn-dependent oxidoreductase
LEVPTPQPGPFEVRIKVAAAALTVGTPVIAFDSGVLRSTKAQAEYLVANLNSIAIAPESTDLTLAATIPLNSMTASLALDHLPLRPRDTLLVTGAAGAVGGYAVELARTRGVRIVAQGRPDDEEFLRGRGATWFVSREENLSAAVRRFVPAGVDGVLDAAALGDLALAAVRDGGIFVSVRNDVVPAPQRGIAVRLSGRSPRAARQGRPARPDRARAVNAEKQGPVVTAVTVISAGYGR